MAIGDDATQAGYPLVPDTGEEGRVRWGARELNRTRDIIALVKKLIPVGITGFQNSSGITSGTSDPVNSDGKPNGTIYFKII
jgi:hypothetical protein